VSNELDQTWKEEVVVYFKALSQYFPVGTEENREETRDSRSPDRDLNQRLAEYETAVLVTVPRPSSWVSLGAAVAKLYFSDNSEIT
jgi:hypothetical protein